jgi:Zn-dependent alcohol dehydrogenase
MTRAAVLTTVGAPLEVLNDVEVDEPGPGEVRIAVAASGICHSDLSAQNGDVAFRLPVVLGHEGSGVVEAVGPDVTRVRPGDHVVVSWVPACGRCFHCLRNEQYLCDAAQQAMLSGGMPDGTTRMSHAGKALHQMAVAGTFSERIVVPEAGAIPIPSSVDLHTAALIGCGVLTGVGAAINTASIEPGDTVAVIGCGGVGLNVVQGSVMAGAGRVIAIDRQPSKLALAIRFGASDVVDAGAVDVAAAVADLTGGRGPDVVFEVIGLQTTITQAVRLARRGGQVVLVGAPAHDVRLDVRVFAGLVTQAKTIRGCWYGSSNPARDVARLLALHAGGRLRLDDLVSRRIALDEINEGLAAVAAGEVARVLVVHG